MLTSLEFDGTTESVEKTIPVTTETYPAAPQWVDHYIYWFCPFNKNHSYIAPDNVETSQKHSISIPIVKIHENMPKNIV